MSNLISLQDYSITCWLPSVIYHLVSGRWLNSAVNRSWCGKCTLNWIAATKLWDGIRVHLTYLCYLLGSYKRVTREHNATITSCLAKSMNECLLLINFVIFIVQERLYFFFNTKIIHATRLVCYNRLGRHQELSLYKCASRCMNLGCPQEAQACRRSLRGMRVMQPGPLQRPSRL